VSKTGSLAVMTVQFTKNSRDTQIDFSHSARGKDFSDRDTFS